MVALVRISGSRLYVAPEFAADPGTARCGFVAYSADELGDTIDSLAVAAQLGTFAFFPPFPVSGLADFVYRCAAGLDSIDDGKRAVRLLWYSAHGTPRNLESVRTRADGQVVESKTVYLGQIPSGELNRRWGLHIPKAAVVAVASDELLIEAVDGLRLGLVLESDAIVPVVDGERRVRISFAGANRGLLRLTVMARSEHLSEFGLDVRFFRALPNEDPDAPLDLEAMRFPLLSHAETHPLALRLDFADPYADDPLYPSHDGGGMPRGELRFAADAPLTSHLATAHSDPLALRAVDGASFVLTRSPLLASPTLELQDFGHYWSPFGSFELSTPGRNGGEQRLLHGLSHHELQIFAGASAGIPGDQLQFARGQPAFDAASLGASSTLELSADSNSSLHGFAQTSWARLRRQAARTAELWIQPEGLQSYAAATGGDELLFRPMRWGVRDAYFPLPPLLGLSGNTGDDRQPLREALEFERTRLAPLRRALLRGAWIDTADVAATDAAERRTPQGFAVETDANGWRAVVFARTAPDVAAPAVAFDLRATTTAGAARLEHALSRNRLLLVAPLAALRGDLVLGVTIHVAGWRLDVSPAAGAAPDGEPILLLKYDDRPLRQLVDDPASWTTLGAPDAKVVERLRGWLARLDGDSLLERARRRVDDPSWNGVLVLGASLGLGGLPEQLRGLAAGLPSHLAVDHVGIDLTTIEPGTADTWRSALFGVVDHDDRDVPWRRDGALGMRVPLLKLRFENDQVDRFECRLELDLGELFDVSVGNGRTLALEGRYESRVGADGRTQGTYIFEARDLPPLELADEAPIREVRIDRVRYLTIQGGRQTTARLLVDGSLRFGEFAGLGIDLFGIDELRFADFGIGIRFDLDDGGLSGLKLDIDYSSLRFDLDLFNRNVGRRLGSLLGRLPLKLRGLRVGSGLKLPDLGFLKLGLPHGGGGDFRFGLDFDLDLGSLGALAKRLERFQLKLLLGWKLSWKDVVAGFRIDAGEGAGNLDLGLQGILRLTADHFNLKRESASGGELLILSADGCQLDVLGKRVPSRDNQRFGVYLFGSLSSGGLFERAAWLASYRAAEQGDDGLSVRQLVLGQRIEVKLDGSSANQFGSVRDALAYLDRAQTFDDAAAFARFASSQGTIRYAPERDWFIALNGSFFGLFDLGLLLQDPAPYGVYAAFPAGAPIFSFDLVYQKVADGIGKYRVEVLLPPAARTLDLGAVAVSLGAITIELYADGGFYVDLGFPQHVDYGRSFVVQGGPFIGKGGLYLGRTPVGGIDESRIPPDYRFPAPLRAQPTFRVGFALRIGLGREFQQGAIRAGLSVSVFGTLEGALVRYSLDGREGTLVRLVGETGIIAEVEGAVDLRLIRARLMLRLYATNGIIVMTGRPVLLFVEAGVTVEIDLEIGRIRIFGRTFSITIHLSFNAHLRFEWALGERDASVPAVALDAAGPAWQAPVLAELLDWTEPRPLTIEVIADVSRSTDRAAPQAQLVLLGYCRRDGDEPPLAALAQALTAWAVWTGRHLLDTGGKRATDVLLDLEKLRQLDHWLAGTPDGVVSDAPGVPAFAALPFELLEAGVATLLRIRVRPPAADAAAGGGADLVALPPALAVGVGGDARDLMTYDELDDAEAQRLFRHLDRQLAAAPTAAPAPADAETVRYSLARRVFRDWCELLVRTTLGELRQQFADRGSAAVSLGELLTRLGRDGRWNELLARTSRQLLAGLRVPAADGAAFVPLLERIGLAVPFPDDDALALELRRSPQAIGDIDIAGDLALDGLAAYKTAIEQAVPAIAIDSVTALPAVRTQPRSFTLPVVAALADRAEALAPFPDGLRAALLARMLDAPAGSWTEPLRWHLWQPLSWRPGAAESPGDELPPGSAHVRLAIAVEMAIERIAVASAAAGTVHARNVYAIAGTSEENRRWLDALLDDRPRAEATLAGAALELLWVDPATGQHHALAAADVAGVVALRTNLSIERRPFTPAVADAEPAAADELYRANAGDLPGFARLLRRAAVVNSGGTFLAFPTATGDVLPAPLFESATGRARLLCVFLLAADRADAVPGVNAAWVGRDALAKLSAPDRHRQLAVTLPSLREGIPLRAPGSVLVRVQRLLPSAPADDAAREAVTDAELARRFCLLEFELAGVEPPTVLLPFDESLPVNHEKPTPAVGDGAPVQAVAALQYDLMLPLARLAAGDALDDGWPYAATGREFEVRLGWRDLYGNRLSRAPARTWRYTDRYVDPLLPVSAWPGITVALSAGAPGTAELQATIAAGPADAADAPLATPGSVAARRLAAQLQTALHQLADPGTHLRLVSDFGVVDTPELTRGERETLSELLRNLRLWLLDEGGAAAGELTIARRLSPHDALLLPVTLELELSRDEVASELLPEIGRVRTPVLLAAGRGQDGDAAQLRAFARALRAAFGPARKLRLALGARMPTQPALWAVDDRAVTFTAATQPPVAFAPPPLSRGPLSATQVPARQFNDDFRGFTTIPLQAVDQDVDALLQRYLAAVERFLSSSTLAALAATPAQPGKSTPFERVVAVKQSLVGSAGERGPLFAELQPVRDSDDARPAELDAAWRELRDACAIDLSRFYDVASVLVWELDSSPAHAPTPAGSEPPKVYGRLRLAGADTSRDGRTLSRGVPLAPGRTHLGVSVIPDKPTGLIDLCAGGDRLVYEITHLERAIDPENGFGDLRASSWLTLIPQDGDAEPLPSIELGSGAGRVLAPTPLRRLPRPPGLLRPDFEPAPSPAAGDFAAQVRDARDWLYRLDLEAEFEPGDEVCLRVAYNAAPRDPGGIATPPETRRLPLLNALIAFEHEAAQLMPEIGATAHGPRFDEACYRFAESAEAVRDAFAVLQRAAADAPPPLEDRLVLDAQPTRGTAAARFVDHLDDDRPWPPSMGDQRLLMKFAVVDAGGGVVGDAGGRVGVVSVERGVIVVSADGLANTLPPPHRRRVWLGRLDALRQQSAWAAASVRRNRRLGDVPDGAGAPQPYLTRPEFVYRTVEVRLMDAIVPYLRHTRTFAYTPPRPARLPEALADLLRPVFAALPADSPPELVVQCRLDYENAALADLVALAYAADPAQAFTPEPDAKAMAVAVRIAKGAVEPLVEKLVRLFASATQYEPIARDGDGRRGRAVVHLVVRSGVGEFTNPLIELRRLTLALGNVRD